MHLQQRILATVAMADIRIAELTAEAGGVPLAIESARSVVNSLVEGDEGLMRSEAVAVLVQSLLMRGSAAVLEEAESEIERVAAMPTDPPSVLAEVSAAADARCRLAHGGTPPHIATTRIAISPGRRRSASGGTWRSPRRCASRLMAFVVVH